MMTTLTAVTPTAVRSAPLLAPVAALVSALLLSGCGTIKPEPLTQDEIGARVSADRAAMYRDQIKAIAVIQEQQNIINTAGGDMGASIMNPFTRDSTRATCCRRNSVSRSG